MAAQGVKGTGRVAKGKSDTVVLAQLTVSPADTPLLMGPVETQLLTFGEKGVELGDLMPVTLPRSWRRRSLLRV